MLPSVFTFAAHFLPGPLLACHRARSSAGCHSNMKSQPRDNWFSLSQRASCGLLRRGLLRASGSHLSLGGRYVAKAQAFRQSCSGHGRLRDSCIGIRGLCANVSRAAPQSTSTSGPVIKGNWIYLPSIGVPVSGWGFAPPGTIDSKAFGFPGANGNYTNGKTSSLLGVSANCPPGNNSNRQTTHGIQSGCE
jgi:hypothetical protein